MRKELSLKYIKGSGIEIGALHCPLPVNDGVHVDYVDRGLKEVLEAHKDVNVKIKNWIVDDATELQTFKPNSLDFLIANHVIEHLENPMKALESWVRCVKNNGIIFIAIPDKTRCFDKDREITSLVHLVQDYHFPSHDRDYSHYLDWFLNSTIEKKPPEKAIELANSAWKDKTNIHFHVWDKPSMDEMFLFFKIEFGFRILESIQNGSEVIFILRKGT